MNRIYLFLFALLASLSAYAADSYELGFNAGDGFKTIDPDNVDGSGNCYTFSVPVNSTEVEFYIHNITQDKYIKRSKSGGVDENKWSSDENATRYFELTGDSNSDNAKISGFKNGYYYEFKYYVSFDYNGNKNMMLITKTNKSTRLSDDDIKKMDLYVINDDGEWNANNKIKMEHVAGTNVWTLTSETAFASSWKIYNGTWDFSYGYNGGNLPADQDNNAKWNGDNFPAIYGKTTVTFTYVSGSNQADGQSKMKYTGGYSSLDDNYYFYADMNRWSIIGQKGYYSTSTTKSKVKVFDEKLTAAQRTEENNKARFVFGDTRNDGPKVPDYYTNTELINNWRFRPLDNNADNKYEQGNIKKGQGWFYLDFTNKRDAEGNVGILCGQFRITKGTWGGENYGATGKTNGKVQPGYFSNTIEVNTSNPFYTPLLEADGKGGQNMQLYNNYVKGINGFGPVVYFKPAKNGQAAQLYIYGEGHDAYVYYTVIGAPNNEFAAPTAATLVDQSQDNYYVNTIGFSHNDGTTLPEGWESGNYNVGGNDGKTYVWEEDENVQYRNMKFAKVYKRRIPSGAYHRFSVQNNVKIQDKDGWFDERAITCGDVWFIRSMNDVNLHFRYANATSTTSLQWVCYNAFNKAYEDNILKGYNYLFGGYKGYEENQPAIHQNEWGRMMLEEIKEGEHKGHWWSTPVKLPASYAANAWAMFADSRGGIFPADRVVADEDDLINFEINGEDVWYEVLRKTEPTLSLLYSHLNGTYSSTANAGEPLQINAEFFLPEEESEFSYFTTGDLMTHTGLVEYSFEISKDRQQVTSSDWQIEPYFEIGGDGQERLSQGYYFIVVKARYGGKIYTAEDTYVVY